MEGETVRQLLKRLLKLGLVLAVVMGPASPAAADTSVAVSGGSWYWASQVPGVPPVGGQNIGQPAALPAPDVPNGDFPVSARAGVSDKETYLHIDATGITGATVTKLVLTLSEDAAAQNLGADTAAIKAVPVTGYFENGSAARPYEEKPPVADGPVAKGVRTADGKWAFDITAIASQWADGTLANNGVALVPDASANPGTTFQVVWSGSSPPPTTSGEVVPGTASSDTGPSAGDTLVPSDTGGGTSAPAPVAVEPDFSTPVTTPSQPPPAATSSGKASPQTGRRAAATRTKGASKTAPAAFFLAAVAVLALLGAGAVALGDWGDPSPERRGSVLRALERRRARPEPTPLEEST